MRSKTKEAERNAEELRHLLNLASRLCRCLLELELFGAESWRVRIRPMLTDSLIEEIRSHIDPTYIPF